jgi:hypothetical protein
MAGQIIGYEIYARLLGGRIPPFPKDFFNSLFSVRKGIRLN